MNGISFHLNPVLRVANLLRPRGVYWITGGGGALGGLLARFLVDKYQAQVVLSSRTNPGPESRQLLDHLGPAVEFHAMDVADPENVGRVYEIIRAKYGRLNGIIHAAGSIAPTLLPDKDVEEFERTLAPKCRGTVILDHVTQAEPLDFFVLFSSLASIVGDFGQCDYAVANRFLDAFAGWRSAQVRAGRRQGKTLAIDWPLWAAGGMHFDAHSEQQYLASAGLEPLSSVAGLEAFEQCLGASTNRVAVVAGDSQRILHLLAGPLPVKAAAPTSDRADNFAQHLLGESELQQEVRRMISQLLKLPEQQLGLAASFSAFGLDSLNMKELADRISRHFQVRLSPTVFFEHETIATLTRFLIKDHGVLGR